MVLEFEAMEPHGMAALGGPNQRTRPPGDPRDLAPDAGNQLQ